LSKPNILQLLFRRQPSKLSAGDLRSGDPERRGQGLFRRGRSRMRAGESEAAISEFDQALALLPDFAEAVAARAESLDTMGRVDEARREYERARALWAAGRTGDPDRRYLFRQHGRFTFEVDSYELALLRVKTGSFPHLACGNALLAQGHPQEALKCYERALKIKQNDPDLVALKGEALSMMESYKPAIEAFDYALAANPKDSESLNARAIAKLALGDLEGANADWRRQIDLLPKGHGAARACIALRLADYPVALLALEDVVARQPNESRWQLYHRTVLVRLGRPMPPLDLAAQQFHPAEFAFQNGVAAFAADRDAARAYWKKTVKLGPSSMIEIAAAHNELSRL
jgi:tetratricopeptide (TPR) repeat protein